ncbi:uncharacterized protein [Thunnus thynnus]|uniref:uncharacterized protein n=1 Tax=Thunnus thynnus TaxID=8237 RepID=UPI003528CC7D
MALGLLLWVSWICLLLFNGSVGLPAIKGYGYPYVADFRNIGDDGEDQVLNAPIFGQTNWQASNNYGTGYSKPPVAQQPNLVPTSQNLPNTPSAREAERLINGESRDWGLDNLDKPLLFPLRPNNQLNDAANSQPSPIQPQSSVSVASTNRVPLSPNTGGSTQYASPTAYYEPTLSYPSQASGSYGGADYGFGHQNQDFNTGSRADRGDLSRSPHLVFEEVFQLPSKNTDGLSDPSYGAVSATVGGYSKVTDPGFSPGYASTQGSSSFPSYPSNVGAQPAYPSEMADPSASFPRGENLDFSRTHYQPRDISSWLPQEPVNTQEVEVSQGLSEPIPPPPPSSYIMQSRNGYQRGRYLLTESKYSPEFPIAVNSKGVKSTAHSQPAATKGVKNPERTKW